TSQKPRIGIIIGSTREGRFGERPAHWIHEIARQRTDLDFELIDLRDYTLPSVSEPMSPAWAPVKNEAAQRWGDKLAAFDGLIIVTPEYNHGPSAVLKNALDYAYKEFNRKPIGFVGYGGVGAARAVEQLRLIAIGLRMGRVAHAVHVGMLECIGIMQQGKTFEDFPHLAQAAKRLLDEMSWWAKVLKLAREGMTTGIAGREQRGKTVTVAV